MLDQAGDKSKQYFDFDVGYLVKSPCRDCSGRDKFPGCMDKCEVLEQIQAALADSMSCANSFSVAEPYYVPNTVLEQL